MLWYILKLMIVLPLIGGLAWGSLRLAKRFEGKLGTPPGSALSGSWRRRCSRPRCAWQ